MIEVTSFLKDRKVDSLNIQFLIDIASYVNIAKKITGNNHFQRNRVNKGGSVYELLKQDIKDGCIIPPIVLASITEDAVSSDGFNNDKLTAVLSESNDLRILDGLQRTYSLIEVYDENKQYFDGLQDSYLVRMEIYLAISDIGILYRMLTLNTGQTPMTLRHQLEILFSKYLAKPIGDINIIREVDKDAVKSIMDFKFSDLIDGYDSYLEKNELPIDRFDILQNVKIIENISKSEGASVGFVEFVENYSKFVKYIDTSIPDWEYPSEDIEEAYKTNSNPFGNRVHRIFNKSQSLTGFGAAIGELQDLGVIKSIEEIAASVKSMQITADDLLLLNKYLDEVRAKSKKIGNGQRIYFKLLFKNLFDKEGQTYLDMKGALLKAKNRALAEV